MPSHNTSHGLPQISRPNRANRKSRTQGAELGVCSTIGNDYHLACERNGGVGAGIDSVRWFRGCCAFADGTIFGWELEIELELELELVWIS